MAKRSAKFETYFSKWKPIRQALPGVATELEALGMERGPKFDKVVEDFFQLQLLGRARKPEDHAKILRKLAGIKELPEESGRKEKTGKAEEERRGRLQAGNRRCAAGSQRLRQRYSRTAMAPGKASPAPKVETEACKQRRKPPR